MKATTKRRASLIGTLLAALRVAVGWAWYQPVHNVVFNNTAKVLILQEEHSALRIASKDAKDIGVPRGFSFQIGTEPMVGRIRFNDDGSIRYRAPGLGLDKVVYPPESWAHARFPSSVFHYRFDQNGELSLIPPSEVSIADGQPSGFPLCLDRIDISLPSSGLTSQCSRSPLAPAVRGR